MTVTAPSGTSKPTAGQLAFNPQAAEALLDYRQKMFSGAIGAIAAAHQGNGRDNGIGATRGSDPKPANSPPSASPAAKHSWAGVLPGGFLPNGPARPVPERTIKFNPGLSPDVVAKLIKPFGSSAITADEVDALKRRLGYDPNGAEQWAAALRHPLNAMSAYGSATQAERESKGGNDSRDALRHTEWSADMTRNIGASSAKDFADAHERSNTKHDKQPAGELMMDLMNNYTGRVLRQAMPTTSPTDIANYARWHGLLQTQPVIIDPK